jgi:hypothetical protein
LIQGIGPCDASVHGVTVKLEALTAVPTGVVTEIFPVLAPFGTVAEMLVADVTVKIALLLPNFTAVTPVKFVPVIVTTVPTRPLSGVKPFIVGGATIVKGLALVAVPPGVVTTIGPVVAFAGTVAVICDGDLTLNEALTPLKVTFVVPERFVPLMVTDVPVVPLVGVKLEIVGVGPVVTVNGDALVAVPPGVVTAIDPVVAPVGTVAVIWAAEFTV